MEHKQNNIRLLRKQKNATQWDLANYLGFESIDRISKWENGLMYPHVLTAIRIARFLGVTVEELYRD